MTLIHSIFFQMTNNNGIDDYDPDIDNDQTYLIIITRRY